MFTRLWRAGQGFNTFSPIGGDQESWAGAELKLRNHLMRMRDFPHPRPEKETAGRP